MTTENNIKIANAKDVLLVSNMAIQKRDGKNFVNVLNDKINLNSVKLKPVYKMIFHLKSNPA